MTAARSYIGGIGASGALVGAAVIAVVMLGTLLAFEGFPIAGDGSGTDAVQVEPSENDIGAATAAALGAAPAAVATAPGAAAAAGPGAGGGAAFGPDASGTVTPGAPGDTDPAPGDPTPPTAPPAPPTDPTGSPNPLNSALGGVDGAVEDATGVNPNLGGTTEPLTDAVDDVLERTTGNDLGGHVDNVTGALP